ncbi:MAG: aminofutalosine synthase MqnE [Bacteroidota bacterium]|nr:aminofutalosine synthase MqnE [Bacteroidota bacterium]
MNEFLQEQILSDESEHIASIAKKVFSGQRITCEEGLVLYKDASLGLLGMLANYVKEKISGDQVFFNRNIHIEPTNICIYHCRFCSYSRKKGEEGSWEYSREQMLKVISDHKDQHITEVHIVGGVHPDRDIHYYGELIREVKKIIPGVQVKAFSAIELDYMIRKAGLSIKEGLALLKECGLDSIPGGGAEIFDPAVRQKICGEKTSAGLWLDIHETAHRLGIPSNATILYGHIETYQNRIDHLDRLRTLQDKTKGFNAFIPLKFRMKGNSLSSLGEVIPVEDLRNFAVSRIFLDNIPHLKAYWPMLGKNLTQLALGFGVDDIDGTIDDTTKIYSMAGAEDEHPVMTIDEMQQIAANANRKLVERDTFYHAV